MEYIVVNADFTYRLERSKPGKHLEYYDAKSPKVYHFSLVLSQYGLWGHILFGPCEMHIFVAKNDRFAEIHDTNVPLIIDNYIGGLQVSVDNIIGVQIFQCEH